MFNKILVMQVREMMDRHWTAAEISRKCHIDTDLVLQIMVILKPEIVDIK